MTLFKRRDIEQYADSLAAYLPGDELFASKAIAGSNFRKLLRGMARELFRSNGFLREYSDGILPDQTQKFLSEWESTLGIPDGCFTGTGTDADRRRDILVKLASLGVQTVDDFQALADLFSITATVIPGEDFPTPISDPKFTIVVEWQGDTPEQSAEINILSCLFERLKPANCRLIILPLNIFAQCGEAIMECGEVFAECNNSLV